MSASVKSLSTYLTWLLQKLTKERKQFFIYLEPTISIPSLITFIILTVWICIKKKKQIINIL